MARCDRTRKVRYGTRKEANSMLTKLLRFRAVEGKTDRLEVRAYACTCCGGWHLTSMDWGGP
jgi:hypothetical protein